MVCASVVTAGVVGATTGAACASARVVTAGAGAGAATATGAGVSACGCVTVTGEVAAGGAGWVCLRSAREALAATAEVCFAGAIRLARAPATAPAGVVPVAWGAPTKERCTIWNAWLWEERCAEVGRAGLHGAASTISGALGRGRQSRDR